MAIHLTHSKTHCNVTLWGVQRRWGSCIFPGRRISLKLELAKKPVLRLAHAIVHELPTC